jgi:predicted ATPase
MLHLTRLHLHTERFPDSGRYPFTLSVLRNLPPLELTTPVTFFVGENGAGKSTVLEAVARKCRIPIWSAVEGGRVDRNPDEHRLQEYLEVTWAHGSVPGSYFAAQIFREFTLALDDFAAADPGQLSYFGGESLMTKSHGQSLMAYFRARYQRTGLYLLDEPETALSPASQLALLRLLQEMSAAGHAQFLICSHSPILLACPGAVIYSFDHDPVQPIRYDDTPHYRIYKAFMADPAGYLAGEEE